MEPEVEGVVAGAAAGAMAAETCDRCGAFATLTPRGAGRYCDACLERLVHPIERGGVTAGSLVGGLVRLTRAVGLKAVVIGLCIYGPVHLARWLLPAQHDLMASISMVAAMLADAMVIALAIDAILEPGPPSAMRAAARTVRRFGAVLAVMVIALFIDALAAALLLFPAVICVLSFSVIAPIALFERRSAAGTLRESYRRMKGHRLVALVAFLVSALPGMAVLAVIVAWEVVWTFRHGAPPTHLVHSPGIAVANLATSLAFLLPAFVTASLYVKTRPEARDPGDPGEAGER